MSPEFVAHFRWSGLAAVELSRVGDWLLAHWWGLPLFGLVCGVGAGLWCVLERIVEERRDRRQGRGR